MEPTASEKLASAIEALRRCEERSMAGLFALEVMHEIRNPLDALGSLVYLAADAQSLSLAHEYMRAAKEQIVVADNGHGISPDNLGRLFQPFFTTKNDEGNGLGLALSRKIVERHGGSIRVRSSMSPGKAGTAFLVDLPIVDGTHAAS
jgi:signal transduction histidine kinase